MLLLLPCEAEAAPPPFMFLQHLSQSHHHTKTETHHRCTWVHGLKALLTRVSTKENIFHTIENLYITYLPFTIKKEQQQKKIIKSEQCRGCSRQRCVIKMPATLIDRRGSPTAAKLLQCFVHSAPLVTYFLRHRQLGSLK